ncbi:hypothetical protein B6V73_00375 [Thioclava sp. JM3]|nr:hypothetical protein B6V73_00375 [Thioclava sp. JM3]
MRLDRDAAVFLARFGGFRQGHGQNPVAQNRVDAVWIDPARQGDRAFEPAGAPFLHDVVALMRLALAGAFSADLQASVVELELNLLGLEPGHVDAQLVAPVIRDEIHRGRGERKVAEARRQGQGARPSGSGTRKVVEQAVDLGTQHREDIAPPRGRGGAGGWKFRRCFGARGLARRRGALVLDADLGGLWCHAGSPMRSVLVERHRSCHDRCGLRIDGAHRGRGGPMVPNRSDVARDQCRIARSGAVSARCQPLRGPKMIPRTVAAAFLETDDARWLAPMTAALCRGFNAHLIGVHGVEPLPLLGGDLASDPIIYPEFLDWQRKEAAAIRETFEHALTAEDVQGEFRSPVDTRDALVDFLVDSCRAADLVVSARVPPHAGRASDIRLQEQLIRQTGRPVLVVSETAKLERPARHVLLGVSCSREAMRAAHDMLYLAASGARIDLLSVSPSGGERQAVDDLRDDLATALDRRGYDVTLLDRMKTTSEAGDELLHTARERGAELIAVGAFGHSRLYDFVIGAVTTRLLETSHLPVLFSK